MALILCIQVGAFNSTLKSYMTKPSIQKLCCNNEKEKRLEGLLIIKENKQFVSNK
jgi:hypothetical protein